MPDVDDSRDLIERVRAAHSERAPLQIIGGNTKSFYGRPVDGGILTTARHRGILSYDPAELVITARSGTPLRELEAALAEHGQCLPFEPPHYGANATAGGMVACGLAGPARATAGTIRDYVLGAKLLTGDARVLKFGGEVIKNVAGYDVSRLLAGSLGILGVLLEVSIKVLPRRPASTTRVFDLHAGTAIVRITEWAGSPLPLTASCWVDRRLHVRFDASEPAVARIRKQVGGEDLPDAVEFWHTIREHTHPFFATAERLIRVHVSATTRPVDAPQGQCIEWHGMQRWHRNVDREIGSSRGIGAQRTVFRGAAPGEAVFTPLPAPVLRLHRALKSVFDPAGILNRGRMYADL